MTRSPHLSAAPAGATNCSVTDLRSPRSPIPAGLPAWIPKEVFRLSHINNDWRLGNE